MIVRVIERFSSSADVRLYIRLSESSAPQLSSLIEFMMLLNYS